jgi:hypothetical protein
MAMMTIMLLDLYEAMDNIYDKFLLFSFFFEALDISNDDYYCFLFLYEAMGMLL